MASHAQQDKLPQQRVRQVEVFGIRTPGKGIHNVRVHAICEDRIPSVATTTMAAAAAIGAINIFIVCKEVEVMERREQPEGRLGIILGGQSDKVVVLTTVHPTTVLSIAMVTPTIVDVVVFVVSVVPPGAIIGPEFQCLFCCEASRCVPPDDRDVNVVVIVIVDNVCQALAAVTAAHASLLNQALVRVQEELRRATGGVFPYQPCGMMTTNAMMPSHLALVIVPIVVPVLVATWTTVVPPWPSVCRD